MYLGASPSKKSVSRLRQKVGDLLVRHNVAPWPEMRDSLNRTLRGWSNYFGYGTRLIRGNPSQSGRVRMRRHTTGMFTLCATDHR